MNVVAVNSHLITGHLKVSIFRAFACLHLIPPPMPRTFDYITVKASLS